MNFDRGVVRIGVVILILMLINRLDEIWVGVWTIWTGRWVQNGPEIWEIRKSTMMEDALLFVTDDVLWRPVLVSCFVVGAAIAGKHVFWWLINGFRGK
jgi:hypothetical protein